jgi:Ca2+-binding EF-hand superfamily protein
LKSFGIQIPLSEIYLLFKRYAWHTEGKMDFNSFCNMFDVCENAYSRIEKNRQIKSLADVDV